MPTPVMQSYVNMLTVFELTNRNTSTLQCELTKYIQILIFFSFAVECDGTHLPITNRFTRDLPDLDSTQQRAKKQPNLGSLFAQ